MDTAKAYATRAKALFNGFKELAADSATRPQAVAALGLLEGLLGRVKAIGVDLLDYHPTLGKAVRAILEPILEGQFLFLEARLAQLKGSR